MSDNMEKYAAHISDQARRSGARGFVTEKPMDKPDIDNAAAQNAEKKNAPGEKTPMKGPEETKGGAGGSTARKADKSNSDPAPKMAAEDFVEEVDLAEAKDLDANNVEKEIKHDCASHVIHKEHGEGTCIPGMHTLEEDENGYGYVTHYDIMFEDEDGPYVIEDVDVEELEIVTESHHGHMRKKKSKTDEGMHGDMKKKKKTDEAMHGDMKKKKKTDEAMHGDKKKKPKM